MNPKNSPLKDLFTADTIPNPIEKPTAHPDLSNLDPLTRSAEALCFSILSIEFQISPKGHVRLWLKNNTRLAVILAIPVFLVLPIVTFGLWQLVSWFSALTAIAKHLVILPLWALLAAIVIGLAWTILRIVLK